MLKHFAWRYQVPNSAVVRNGRFAILLEAGQFRLQQLAGPAPFREVLGVLPELLGEEEWNDVEKGWREFPHPWRVEVKRGMSGCEDYLFRVQLDPQWGHAPIWGRVHVSMAGKLNEPVSIPARLLPPILEEMFRLVELKVSPSVYQDGEIGVECFHPDPESEPYLRFWVREVEVPSGPFNPPPAERDEEIPLISDLVYKMQ